MSVPKDTVKSVSQRVTLPSRLSRLFAAGVLLIGVSVIGASMSSALNIATVDFSYTYDCSGSTGRVTPPDMGSGVTQTVTVTGTGCGTMNFVVMMMWTGNDPVLTKNGTPIASSTPTSVAAGDVFVLTAEVSGQGGYGRLDFENSSQATKVYDWSIDTTIISTSTTTTMVQPTTTTTNQSPTSTTAPGGADVGSVAGDRVAPAFAG